MFKQFGIEHILILLAIAALTVGLYFLLRKRTLKTQRIVILCILFSNLALHFLKLAFYPYNANIPGKLHTITLENICAITTVIAPFIFLFIKKESPIHDYMFFIMVIGGLLGCLIPTEARNKDMAEYWFEIFRYFYCHGLMLVVALLTQLLGIHKVKARNVWIIPVGLIAYETIIFCNELILFKANLLDNVKDWETFFDSNLNNNSFTFGVTPDMEEVKPFFYALTPKFLRYMKNGYESCLPVVWLIIPASLYTPAIFFFFAWPFILKNSLRSKKEKHQIEAAE